ncbi:MAG: hypothetical protein A2521_13990 [Deltaproteobacteria bacterium RIFOXYD12_FULL_57_12]|nr:MAG: hypothetical protein A2521_13990 [Deltaproteobacteria bacterium RIFOXYD12_FULL_57_12]
MAGGPIKTITNGLTAWTLVGSDFDKETTIYFFPNGKIRNGRQIPDWDEIPSRTKLLVGYKGPYLVTDKRDPPKLAGSKYMHPDTVYYLAGKGLVTGDTIKDLSLLPNGTSMFLPI